MVQKATYETASEVMARCEPCREDFQTTFDILDWMLDEEMTRADLVSAMSWMNALELVCGDGSVWIEKDNIFLQMGTSGERFQVEEELIDDVALAVWSGINNIYPE